MGTPKGVALWILGNAFSVFVGGEAVKGWILEDASPWLASFADWPLFLALSVACILSFVAANWLVGARVVAFVGSTLNKLKHNTPSSLFQRMYDDIVHEFNRIEQDEKYEGVSDRSRAAKFSQREMLKFSLSKCGIETPRPGTDSDHIWYEFIARLAPLSLDGRIDEARDFGDKFSKRRRSG